MPLSLNEIRARAERFAREWQNAASERAEAQTFWNEFFDIFGVSRRRVAAFERPVASLFNTGGRGRIDLLWKGRLLVEHKSRGEDLDRAAGQARDYFAGLKDADLPRYVIVSDFARIRLYDLEGPDPEGYVEFPLRELPRRIGLFGFISGYETRSFGRLNPVDVEAARRLGELHDALEDSGYRGHPLQVWMVRLLFCLFADSTGIFETGLFREYIDRRTAEDGSDLGPKLAKLFEVLNTPEAERARTLDEQLAGLRYVNGRLFAERLPIPDFDSRMRGLLLDATRLDWAGISPAIFGSLFQSIKDRQERRRLGEHYTTEANILKALRPLFLDPLREELARARHNSRALQDFHRRLSRIRILDPACGCGNFLVVAYRELRLLELEVLRARYGEDAGLGRGLVQSIVDVDQFSGIEIEEWPAQIAQVAMWLTDHQMNLKVSEEFGQAVIRLPLVKSANIVRGNALAMDWASLLPPGPDSFIVGNPPFGGARMLSAAQRSDMNRVFNGVRNNGLLDYVTCWYLLAARHMQSSPATEAAFVSTNSITQGEQPGVLWPTLWPLGVKINFAHRTFQWTSEARGRAAVHCVIIGFALHDRSRKRLFDYDKPDGEPHEIEAKRINPYLVDGPMLTLPNRRQPICASPALGIGNQPIDGGNYLFTEEERAAFLSIEPEARRFFRPWVGTDELLYGYSRWCLWLGEASPAEIRAMPEVHRRVRAVQEFRRGSRRAQTLALAETPTRFEVENMPARRYLAIPEVSSEARRWIPMAFLPPRTLASNLLKIAADATLYHFGVLSSTMHMAWVRAVCGRLESRYRYSTGIVYNNFPWPEPTPQQRAVIEAKAQAVLDARAAHPGATLADLYDPAAMPPNLVAAHAALDRAVDAAYGAPRGGWTREADRVVFLLARYQALTAPLDAAPPQRRTRGRSRT
ncbi:MAG: hypothetical protein QJR07_00175 [Acetobacteraceae bacterium]|nr:hypothetical protein [Acetobacteraceae bacterium]